MLYGKANIFASEIAPNPAEVKYWADLRADSFGKVIKVYVKGKWEPIAITNINVDGEISYELLKNKPSINGVILEGNVTLDKLGIQSSDDMSRFVEDDELATLIPQEYVTEDELTRDVYTKEQVDNMINSVEQDHWIDV